MQTAYVAEFQYAYQQQLDRFEAVFPEIAFRMPGETFQDIYVVDFVGRTGADNGAVEVSLNEGAYVGGYTMSYGDLTLEVGPVSWESIAFNLTPAPPEVVGFETWFAKWVDLEGARRPMDSMMSQVIHSAVVERGRITVDFGTAPVEAATELLDLFIQNGVLVARIDSGRQ
ncbi:hypothetical protein ATO6_17840 [Oceanicola sp. 22II-s10i]|nr:hypothetical protein ATO6_17840 [Oceanicola sp. 22II-s10i]